MKSDLIWYPINKEGKIVEETTIVKEANATLKYARISARKVKIVADLIRGVWIFWMLQR